VALLWLQPLLSGSTCHLHWNFRTRRPPRECDLPELWPMQERRACLPWHYALDARSLQQPKAGPAGRHGDV